MNLVIPTHRLVAILVADVVGYSRHVSEDEAGALQRLRQLRYGIVEPTIAKYAGRLFKVMGDGFLAEFPDAVSAAECALAIQAELADANTSDPKRMVMRIGIHHGEVTVEGEDLLGDNVNIAARLESIAAPGGITLSHNAHELVASSIAVSFSDGGERMLKNIGRPIRVFELRPAGAPTAVNRFAPPEKPSVAVLPFRNLSGDADQTYFADGIVEEIIAALSRMRFFFVISRNSSFVYRDRSVDTRQVARDLGVRYVLEGSVRRAGDQLRITAQLIDGNSGLQVWGDRYDGELSDVFALQDRVTEAIVGALRPSIGANEIERARRKPPESLDAYDRVMRALPSLWSEDPKIIAEGLANATEAMELEPDYALPPAIVAWCRGQLIMRAPTDTIEADRQLILDLAQRAATLDPNHPLVLTVLGTAYSLVSEYEQAHAAIERALTLDPNSAWTWSRSGYLKVYMGESDIGIEHFHHALRLSPLDPLHYNSLFGIGIAYFFKGEFRESARWIEKALFEKPTATWAYRMLAASYAKDGRVEDAKKALARLLKDYPDITISKAIAVLPRFMDYSAYGEGLRLAGMAE